MADTGLERERQSLGVHPRQHQHLAGGGIGDDRGDQTVGIELGLERESASTSAGEPRSANS